MPDPKLFIFVTVWVNTVNPSLNLSWNTSSVNNLNYCSSSSLCCCCSLRRSAAFRGSFLFSSAVLHPMIVFPFWYHGHLNLRSLAAGLPQMEQSDRSPLPLVTQTFLITFIVAAVAQHLFVCLLLHLTATPLTPECHRCQSVTWFCSASAPECLAFCFLNIREFSPVLSRWVLSLLRPLRSQQR